MSCTVNTPTPQLTVSDNELFNELFNTFLGDDSIEECLKKAEVLTCTAKDAKRDQSTKRTQEMQPRPGTKRKITVKPEPFQYKYDCGEAQPYLEVKKQHLDNQGKKFCKSENKELNKLNDSTTDYKLTLKECLMMDEKALKKARRKIKNKISAQESRRKKKEYVEGLERRISVFSCVNDELKERISELENINREMVEKIDLLTIRPHSGSHVVMAAGVSVHTQTELCSGLLPRTLQAKSEDQWSETLSSGGREQWGDGKSVGLMSGVSDNAKSTGGTQNNVYANHEIYEQH